MRVLQTVLTAWDLDNPEILPLLEKLIYILGHITLSCTYDGENKPTEEPKSSVLLTQSYNSTLAQEIINLLRILHGIVGWNQALNSILVHKLNTAAYYSSENALTMNNDGSRSYDVHCTIIAALNVIGSWDVRPRVGAIVEVDSQEGTVVRTTQKGKLCIHLHGSGEIKKVLLNAIKLMPNPMFNLERMPLSENMIRMWAQLLLNKQSTCLTYSEKRPVHGK